MSFQPNRPYRPNQHKPRSWFVSFAMMVVVVLLTGGVVFWHYASMTNSSDGSQGSANANASTLGIASVTVPMQPVAPPPNSGIRISQPGQVPAYTVDDVRAFFLTHPLMGGHARPGTTVTLNTVQFLLRGDAEKALRGESLQGQVAAGGIVCYLTFTGTFDLSSIHALPALDGTPVRLADAHHTHLVLDATTGRTLIWGLDEPLRDAP